MVDRLYAIGAMVGDWMMGRGTLSAATAIVAVLASTLSVEPLWAKAIVLQPVSPWNVDWSKTTCTLRRAFGTIEDPSVLTIERFGPSGTFQLSITSSDFRSFQQGQNITLEFGEAKPHSIMSVSPGRTGEGKAVLFFSTQSLGGFMKPGAGEWDPPVTPEMEAATKTISVSYSGRQRIFATGPLDKPFAALRKCTDDLVSSWGFDAKQQAALKAHPKPVGHPASWISDSDYPPAMLSQGKQALINFRLSIDAKGRPTACEIQRSHNDVKFDELSCALLLRRARFSPALDAAGVPVPSYYLNTVRWIMG